MPKTAFLRLKEAGRVERLDWDSARRIADEAGRGLPRGNCHSESYVTEGISKLIVRGENEAPNGVAILCILIRPATRSSYGKSAQYRLAILNGLDVVDRRTRTRTRTGTIRDSGNRNFVSSRN